MGQRPMRVRWKKGFAYRPMRADTLFMNVSSRAPAPRLIGVSVLLAAVVAGCSQAPSVKRSKEFFPTSVYGAASPKVVEDGAPVPRGGGRYLVGKPYTIAGRVYTPKEVASNASQTGKASWYGAAFHGRRTSNGEVYDMRSVSAAHPTWPLPSYVRVTNTGNGRSMIVRLNDRGPFHSSRIMDVSSRVAEALDFKRMGTANIKVDFVGKAGLAGSDDQILIASLRTDGRACCTSLISGLGGVTWHQAATNRHGSRSNAEGACLCRDFPAWLFCRGQRCEHTVFLVCSPRSSPGPALARARTTARTPAVRKPGRSPCAGRRTARSKMPAGGRRRRRRCPG